MILQRPTPLKSTPGMVTSLTSTMGGVYGLYGVVANLQSDDNLARILAASGIAASSTPHLHGARYSASGRSRADTAADPCGQGNQDRGLRLRSHALAHLK
ncbi:hypothetical protein ACFVJ4_39270 [Streptomyces sp. NPDC127178]|uniref:hypothetical protein n=1 Tax=unclassified Streptomyces TaxID=2593676 RepID=UPI00364213E0